LLVSIIALLFLILNLIFAPHNPYQEKYSIFECGFHSFLGQNRIQFNIKFFTYAFLYLILDLEILLIFPLALSTYTNSVYGIIIAIIFIIIVTIGFVFELGKGALEVNSRQGMNNNNYNKIIDISNIIYLQNIINKKANNNKYL
jgi:NADH-ubiquinone oxidoreductase chain 3